MEWGTGGKICAPFLLRWRYFRVLNILNVPTIPDAGCHFFCEKKLRAPKVAFFHGIVPNVSADLKSMEARHISDSSLAFYANNAAPAFPGPGESRRRPDRKLALSLTRDRAPAVRATVSAHCDAARLTTRPCPTSVGLKWMMIQPSITQPVGRAVKKKSKKKFKGCGLGGFSPSVYFDVFCCILVIFAGALTPLSGNAKAFEIQRASPFAL